MDTWADSDTLISWIPGQILILSYHGYLGRLW